MKMFASLALFGMFASVGLSANVTCDDAQSDSSCDETSLSGTDILCRGYKSCYESDLTCSEDCMCGGLLACHGSEIVATDDATCFGEYGCKYATITAEDIWCDGRYGCKFTNLTASNNIYCDGEYACRLNRIKSVNYLYVDGDGGGQSSVIKGFNRIYARGYEALTYSTIKSDDSSTTISVFGGAKTTYGATYTCGSGSTCYIYCTSNTGCENLDVYCYGTCSIDCDSDYECPTETDMSLLTDPEASLQDKQKLLEIEASLISKEKKLNLERENERKKEKEKDDKIEKQQKLKWKKNKQTGLINSFFNNNGDISIGSSSSDMNNILIFGIIIGFIASGICFTLYNYCIAKYNNNTDAKYESLV